MVKRVKPTEVTVNNSIDKYASKCYYVSMINAIKNKYYTYDSNEFLPIYVEGKLANRKEFHLYKLNRALIRADRAWMDFVKRAHAS